ncbi:Rrf2 family transcriptional regulator [Pseudorhodobacter sp.]|uniref:RrF2 family transcriptional regulator n=1 Tax=Pseudorhodobacter sp. TaxID=1934400 RepID=UPI0026497EFA|nr:Rrf2 family transcriptional regulator [Pseudorhodobacter sp.]MDN5789220.1 Rrf2 family transcriptional regulator [Pseudorhodobacter sp.]
MRLTIRTNLALRTLMYCAVNPGVTVRKTDVATACNASENHLAQVIHKLGQAGFLTTVRGRTGGLRLQRDAAEITVGEVVRAFESTTPFTTCMEPDGGDCPLAASCRLTCVFADALAEFYRHLDAVRLRDLVEGNHGLSRLLKVA